jgi:hypothetical protein
MIFFAAMCFQTPAIEYYTKLLFVLHKKQNVASLIKKTPWPESESELYRLRERHLSAELVTAFADRGVMHSECGKSLMVIILVS